MHILEGIITRIPAAAFIAISLGLVGVGALFLLPVNNTVAQDFTSSQHQEIESAQTTIMGMDEAINESLAEQAGRPPRDPYINIEALGDVWNTILLLAGGICGFLIGRWWDLLFGKKLTSDDARIAY
ncbi:MAG: hypothetical protein ISR65_15840 [Bacteriovoracaceae bacterium]|nr:hypothetical protein [Bacteriovoracaceae bacterium]